MQAQLDSGILRISSIPGDVTSLRLLLNGIQCFQQEHDGKALNADVPIREELWSPEMAAVLPGHLGESLQVYAMDEDACVRAIAVASDPGLTWQKPNVEDRGGRRVVGSALRTPRDVHRWEFRPAVGKGAHVARLCVSFDIPHTESVLLAFVTWTLNLGDEHGTITNHVDIGNGVSQSLFDVALPAEWDGTILCEISATATCNDELRYVVYRDPWGLAAATRSITMGKVSSSVGRKMAVLVGVSKYTRRPKKRMSDLEYADDDIVQWYHYLQRLGFECKVFGDEYSP
jgi:hypothetical protein